MTSCPMVGITTYVAAARWGPWAQTAALTPLAYAEAVAAAGGRAVLLPPAPRTAVQTTRRLDAVILCGGPDIEPSLYGAPRDPATAVLAPERDGPELELIDAALVRDLPLLGICRGMQLLNVARGGTLVQDLAGHVTRPGHFDAHRVSTVAATRTASILGSRLTVMSGHHQGVDRVGDGLVVAARSSDGAIEAIEDPGKRFALGVLWHPEQGADGRLFEALVQAVV